ncbi:histamine H2 receptor-like [Acropora millepora]|uniref:histamine H2 receptor-like n=1 Tax=Acropora millepora TaxID=45264 RepID=UPI001CF3F08E|nr:histamine H2 receptor-like [Acropora millepora]
MAALLGHSQIWNVSMETFIRHIRASLETTPSSEATILCVCFSIVSIITVIGNTLVIVAVVKDPLKTLRSSPTNFILLEMASADLFVGMVLAPSFALLNFSFEEKAVWDSLFFVTFFSHFFVIVSAYHVFLLTIDRYFALAKPLKYKAIVTKTRVVLGSSSIWVFSLSYAALTLTIGASALMIPWLIFVLLLFLSSEGISLAYVLTLANLVKHYKARMKDTENSHFNQLKLYQREKKVSLVIFSVIIAFDICYFPWIVVQLVFVFCQSCSASYRAVIVSRDVAMLLIFINSSLNPLLYSWRFSKFQATYKYFWRKYCCKKQRRKTTDINQGRRQRCEVKL